MQHYIINVAHTASINIPRPVLRYMQILEYHVYAEDAYKVSDLAKHNSLVTVEGETLTVSNTSSASANGPRLLAR